MKRISCFAVALMFVYLAGSVVLADQGIKAFLDGEEIVFGQPPVIEEGLTLVPARAIMEALGLTLAYDGETGTVTGTSDDFAVVMIINDTAAQVNGETVTLVVPPKIINGSTMVPLRFMGEAFGLEVGWNPETREINLTSGSMEEPSFIRSFSDETEIADYLTEKFPSITLGGNKYSFTYEVNLNTSPEGAYDYRIIANYSYNLMSHFSDGSTEQKLSETQELKNFMQLIAEDLVRIAPDKKLTGNYRYHESISVFNSISYDDYEWTNYGALPLYTQYDKTTASKTITWVNDSASKHLFELDDIS